MSVLGISLKSPNTCKFNTTVWLQVVFILVTYICLSASLCSTCVYQKKSAWLVSICKLDKLTWE